MAERLWRRPASLIRALLVPLFLIVLWELAVVVLRLPAVVLPAPSRVLTDIATNWEEYVAPTFATVRVMGLGLFAGTALGVLAAVLAWWTPFVAAFVVPFALIMRSIPFIVAAPIIASVLAYDPIASVVALPALVSFFPAFVLTASGLRNAPPGASDVFRALGAGKRITLIRLAIPAAVPNLMASIRINATYAIFAALVADFVVGSRGLGSLFVYSRMAVNFNRSVGAALVAMAISVGMFLAASALERLINGRFR